MRTTVCTSSHLLMAEFITVLVEWVLLAVHQEQLRLSKAVRMTTGCLQIPIRFQMEVNFLIMKLVMVDFQLQVFWMKKGDFYCCSF